MSAVEHSMHTALPTIILSDTGGAADAIALKLNESLEDKDTREKETKKRALKMPQLGNERDFFGKSQEEHLQKLYTHIESARKQREREKVSASRGRPQPTRKQPKPAASDTLLDSDGQIINPLSQQDDDSEEESEVLGHVVKKKKKLYRNEHDVSTTPEKF